jgi:hypothetical protein
MGKGHIGLVEFVSFLCDSLNANTKYSHRQIFGTLPRNVDEEDLVDPQVSSLNVLKAQRARKAGNTVSTPSQHTVHTVTDQGIAKESAQRSSTLASDAMDTQQSSSAISEKASEHHDENRPWNFEDEEFQFQIGEQPSSSRGGASTLPCFDSSF